MQRSPTVNSNISFKGICFEGSEDSNEEKKAKELSEGLNKALEDCCIKKASKVGGIISDKDVQQQEEVESVKEALFQKSWEIFMENRKKSKEFHIAESKPVLTLPPPIMDHSLSSTDSYQKPVFYVGKDPNNIITKSASCPFFQNDNDHEEEWNLPPQEHTVVTDPLGNISDKQ